MVCGHRRYRALQTIGGDVFVPCEVRADIKDADVLKIQLEENIQRKQMSAFEIMEAIERLKARSEKKLTTADIGKILNKSQQWVAALQYAVSHAEEVYGKSGLEKAKREKYTMGKIISDMNKKRAEETAFRGHGFSGHAEGNSIKIKCDTKADADALLSHIKNFQATGFLHMEKSQCPFGVRDLTRDECYSGSGRNRCPHFVRYDWEQHPGCIACNHPPVDPQREFDFGQWPWNRSGESYGAARNVQE